MKTTLVNLLTFGILFSSIISITTNNPIISIIFLITAFVNAAGYLILIGINFIGISYIVIYVGAIAVLFLFIILMINIKLTDILDTGYNFTKNLPLGLNISSLLLFIFFSVQQNLFPFFPTKGLPLFASFSPKAPNGWEEVSNEGISSINYSNIIVAKATAQEISDVNLFEFTQIEVLGHFLYTYASIFLIILSLILLLAMLAIIIISKKNNTNI
jgi:NADH-ubiquinone oxidoreductase chain 6